MKAYLDMNGKIRLIACGVFRSALKFLNLEKRHPELQVTFLPSNLHLQPQKLRNTLLEKIGGTKARDEITLCLYGNCFPDMDDFCRHYGVFKVPGIHCFEMLLGTEPYENLINEIVGTYFVERDLIVNFKKHCVEPLALWDDEIRRALFKSYSRLLYIRQPSDPNLASQAMELARFLALRLEIRDADYLYLDQSLVNLLEVFKQKVCG